jgi:hypothetical protein
MGAPALRAGAPSQRRPAPKGRWPPPKRKVYDGKWYYTFERLLSLPQNMQVGILLKRMPTCASLVKSYNLIACYRYQYM